MSQWDDFKADHQYELVQMRDAETEFEWDLQNTTTWKTATGKMIKINEMGTSHLINSIALMERNGLDRIIRGECGPFAEDHWCDIDPCPLYEALCDELNYRNNKIDEMLSENDKCGVCTDVDNWID